MNVPACVCLGVKMGSLSERMTASQSELTSGALQGYH